MPLRKQNDGIETYLLEGLVPALEVIQRYFPEQLIHAVGYCLGGTLLMIAASYFENKYGLRRFHSLPLLQTFIATMLWLV